MSKTVIGAMAVLGFLSAAHAEFRVWSSKDGASNVEAQFIQMSGSKVVLENKDGGRIMVPMNKLCTKDQEYLAGVIPPELKIKVDKDVDTEKLEESSSYSYSYVEKEESINIEVTIEKISKAACSREFKAHLYIIAEAMSGGKRRVLKHETQPISFIDSESAHFTGSAKAKNTEESGYSTGSETGWTYEGYLVVVEDEEGHLIASETNKSSYESKLQMIKKNAGSKSGFEL